MNTFTSRCLCSFIALCIWGGVASAQIVEIPDPNLRQAIREALALPDEIPITEPEMLRLTGFAAEVAQVENITGLEYALNLKRLYLRDNPIKDLTPLANLTQLELLHLPGVLIQDLTFLSNLTQLKELHLSHCRITDLTPIQNLTQLLFLNLAANQIVDISPLANLTVLETLWLQHNQIVDISSLANLTALTKLRVDSNQIVDVSPLASLTQLTDLTIANNAITDFRPLFGLNLQSVDIDIHKLQELTSSEIEIPDPNLRQAVREALALPDEIPITQLEMLRLTGFAAEVAQVENITGLEYALNLKRLYLRGNPIADLTPLANLTQLELLHLIGVPINDLTPIQNLTQLKQLYLDFCGITDIAPIQNLTKLGYLSLAGNRIVDISPLANLKMLETLWLHENQILDVSPLTNLKMLKTLWLYRNQIVDISPLANLTALENLLIHRNQITDFSPVQGLSLTDFRYDQVCLIPRTPIQDRIENRSLPSIVQGWDDTIVNLPELSRNDRIAYHDLFWFGSPFGLRYRQTPQGYQRIGDLPNAIASREELIAKNPNMLFLIEMRIRSANLGHYPEDWPYWLRDEEGNLVRSSRFIEDNYLLDFRIPEMQDVIVQQAIAVAQCGLYDGIFFDEWTEDFISLQNSFTPTFYQEGTPEYHRAALEEREARISILRRIREAVPEDFLIVCNNNWALLPHSIPYINGGFLETFRDLDSGYSNRTAAEIEEALLWYEENAREPRINILRAAGVTIEPHDSPTNQRWMRFFTTMSLTLSDGYSLYVTGVHIEYQRHYWYPFYDVNLGQPISPRAQRYQDVPNLYIREFTNGWAVYNRSGNVQEISLPENATGVASGQTGKAHQLPDLDGEIYLKTVAGQPTSPYDLNMDGVVNVLDLILTAQNLGSTEGDINGDGITNILDLILVAQHLGETSTPAAPAALHVSLSPETVQKWIDMAYAQNDGSVIFAQGIAMLERLLALMIPDKTVLRANYPNPFNPETWIPYHLASETEVRISIYDLRGVLVRQFNIGHQKAGYYTDRRKAVYWDGRNEIGEPVSSGIYFYTLTTDDYTGTRRMVILK